MYIRKEPKEILRNLMIMKRKELGKTLMRYLDVPLDYAESLTDSTLGSYRFRVGDYRIICDIEGRDIVVLRIGHRRELYKR